MAASGKESNISNCTFPLAAILGRPESLMGPRLWPDRVARSLAAADSVATFALIFTLSIAPFITQHVC